MTFHRGIPPRHRPRRLRGIFMLVGVLLLLICLGTAFVALGAWMYISQDLPRIERLADYRPPAVTQILAFDGRLMTEYAQQRRYVVPLDQIPRQVQLAFVAAEDGSFFHHKGIDLVGIARAALANLLAGRVVQGGSTITQQVARGLLLTPHRTMMRKLKEMVLAWRMERSLGKNEILFLYLNQNYLGHGAYGVEAAARTYFGKSAKDLQLAEGALLAGLVQAPSRYSPLRHPRRARTRQVYVLERMASEGFITRAQARQAQNQTLEVRLHRPQTVSAPYYEEAVRQWLEERFGRQMLYEGGLTVHTACDPRLTEFGRQAIAAGLAQLTRRQGYWGPLRKAGAEELAAARERPLGPGEVQAGQKYKALVTRLDQQAQRAELRLGPARGYLTLEQVRWARTPIKDLKESSPRITSIQQVLSPGDEVLVRALGQEARGGWWRLELLQEPMAQSALIAMENHTGRVRVLIGGSSFAKSQYNRALQARRQPGSAFKPIIYAAALDRPRHPFTATSLILDSPVVYDDPSVPGEKWRPKNYSSQFYGPTTLRQALAHSRNVVTVKLLAELGLGYTIGYARRLGITSELVPNLSLALGTSGLSLLELTRAYGVFDNQGRLMEPVLVERVLDRNGKVLYEAQTQERQVISPQTAYLMTNLLKGVIEEGTGRMMRDLRRPLAGKTGTTNDLKDAWFVGFSPQLVCGVWVGQDDNRPLGHRETGARAAGPIWKQFMAEALKGQPAEDFPVPAGVVFARVNRQTGQSLASGEQGGFFEAFKEGLQPGSSATARGPDPAKQAEGFLEAESFVKPEAGGTVPRSPAPPTPRH
ncbi:MAG: PBP1A family penicillin-binding protein [Thermodesulfobacteriota bacterium]